MIPFVKGVHAAVGTIVADVSRTKFAADAGQASPTNPFEGPICSTTGGAKENRVPEPFVPPALVRPYNLPSLALSRVASGFAPSTLVLEIGSIPAKVCNNTRLVPSGLSRYSVPANHPPLGKYPPP